MLRGKPEQRKRGNRECQGEAGAVEDRLVRGHWIEKEQRLERAEGVAVWRGGWQCPGQR